MNTDKHPSERSLIILCLVLLMIIRMRDGFTGHWVIPEEVIISSIILFAGALGLRRI